MRGAVHYLTFYMILTSRCLILWQNIMRLVMGQLQQIGQVMISSYATMLPPPTPPPSSLPPPPPSSPLRFSSFYRVKLTRKQTTFILQSWHHHHPLHVTIPISLAEATASLCRMLMLLV
jgi:hypothetical protein